MRFISHAQNHEDVMLWRALKRVESGFYLDVGSNDPEVDSVTRAFYDRGWRGINVEPLPRYRARTLDRRPRDITECVAAGAEEGTLTLFDVPAIEGWATLDARVAEQHRGQGHVIVEIPVPVRTLNALCAQHVTGDIHFLKIDVEGFEREVLRGIDLRRWRPWILLIEALVPARLVPSHETWEPIVLGQGYRFTHFDGLNRFYVAEEHPELIPALQVQPNVLDDYVPAAQEEATHRAHRAEVRANIAEFRMAELHRALEEAHGRLAAAEVRAEEGRVARLTHPTHPEDLRVLSEQLDKVLASRSWRVTRPLRWVRERLGALARLRTSRD